MASDGASPSWEEVLADCEASAQQAEELLRGRNRFDADRFADLTGYDLWKLNLPPLPTELTARARSVQERQVRLQSEMISAMTAVAQQIQISSANIPLRQGSLFLDRSV